MFCSNLSLSAKDMGQSKTLLGVSTFGLDSKGTFKKCRTGADLAPIGKAIEQEIKKDDCRLQSLLRAVLSPSNKVLQGALTESFIFTNLGRL